MSKLSRTEWFHLVPAKAINKTAALVTGQAGCAEDDERLTVIQEREAIKCAIAAKEKFRKEVGFRHPLYAQTGVEIYDLMSRLNDLKGKLKYPPNFSDYIVSVLKPRFTKHEWERIIREATKLKESETDN